jgi:hypothetical protein
MGDIGNAYNILGGKSDGKRRLWSSISIWNDNIKTNFEKIGCETMDCTDVAEYNFRWRDPVNTVTKSERWEISYQLSNNQLLENNSAPKFSDPFSGQLNTDLGDATVLRWDGEVKVI